MSCSAERSSESVQLFDARVVSNSEICREHYRLCIAGPDISFAKPGQFLQLGPSNLASRSFNSGSVDNALGTSSAQVPLLRRAFSIAGLRQRPDGGCEMDVIYRVVGTATTWMASLRDGHRVSAIGPLGEPFPRNERKRHAWLVAGGVGLPPMLWLAEALTDRGRQTIAFVGARNADLLPLTIPDRASVTLDIGHPRLWAVEFAAFDTPVVIATDDGSIGYHGFVPSALAAYYEGASVPADDVVVYTCGPEPMMESVARFCVDRSIECYVCMERAMACGMGTCQSCVVAVRFDGAPEGWRYELCCTQGPVFDARRIIWSHEAGGGVQH